MGDSEIADLLDLYNQTEEELYGARKLFEVPGTLVDRLREVFDGGEEIVGLARKLKADYFSKQVAYRNAVYSFIQYLYENPIDCGLIVEYREEKDGEITEEGWLVRFHSEDMKERYLSICLALIAAYASGRIEGAIGANIETPKYLYRKKKEGDTLYKVLKSGDIGMLAKHRHQKHKHARCYIDDGDNVWLDLYWLGDNGPRSSNFLSSDEFMDFIEWVLKPMQQSGLVRFHEKEPNYVKKKLHF